MDSKPFYVSVFEFTDLELFRTVFIALARFSSVMDSLYTISANPRCFAATALSN